MKFNSEIKVLSDALSFAKMDFEVKQSDIINEDTGKTSNISKSIYKSTNGLELGIVGKKYRILQNWEAFDFFNIMSQDSEVHFKEYYLIGGGKICILKVDLDNIGDYKKRIVLINGHDGKVGCGVRFELYSEKWDTSITGNFENVSNEVKIKHTMNVKQNLEEAKRIKEISDDYFIEMNRWCEYFSKVGVGGVEEKIFKSLGYKGSNKTDSKVSFIKDLYQEKSTCALHLLVSFSEWVDKYSCKTEEKRIVFSNLTKGLRVKENMFNLMKGSLL